MKRILLTFLFLFCFVPLVNAGTSICGGRPAAGGAAASCATDSTDATQTDVTGSDIAMITNACYGQGFQVSKNGKISAIDVYLSAATSCNMTCRWGTGSDFTSSYTATQTVTPPDSTGFYKVVFDTKGDVTTSTQYYFGCVENSGTCGMDRSEVNPYASGMYLYTSSTNWNCDGTSSGSDVGFKIYLCD